MMSKRVPFSPETMYANIQAQGHEFANIGISAIVDTEIDGHSYSLVVRQDRRANKDFNDVVLKLLSGYLDVKHLVDPQQAIMEELGEECIVQQGELVLPLAVDGVPCSKPFEGKVAYSRQTCDLTSDTCDFSVPDLSAKRVVVMDGCALGNNVRIYFHAPTNSAQLVYHYNLALPQGVSLHHTEDRFNPEAKSLDTHMHENGMLLLETKSGELTGRVFALKNGVCEEQDPKGIVLSEAFDKKVYGVTSRFNVSLEEAVRRPYH
jgi:hypothetical protein